MSDYKGGEFGAIGGDNDQNLQGSGGVSGTGFENWTVFTQSIEGMWTRKYVFNTTPTYVDGVPSGSPTMSYSYLDVNCTVTTRQELISASYASGFAQNLGLGYKTDSTVGGWGMSGLFFTSALGMTRNLTIAGDEATYCTQNFNTLASRSPGIYVANGNFDTSGNFGGTFFTDVIMPASNQCDDFKVSLVVV